MKTAEVEQALKTLTLIVDTREQETPLLHKRIRDTGLPSRREKLEYGDYSADCRLSNGCEFTLARQVCIERKMNLDELCACFGKERSRFRREFERAAFDGAKIYLLIENGSWENVFAGRYGSHMTINSLAASMTTWMARYNCQLVQCSPTFTGRIIREILYREMKERLTKL